MDHIASLLVKIHIQIDVLVIRWSGVVVKYNSKNLVVNIFFSY